MQPIEFLTDVWGHSCQDGDTVFLSTKSVRSGRFKDHRFQYGRGIQRRLKEWFANFPDTEFNIYFCPTPFNEGKRRRENVARVNLLWSDIDEGRAKLKPTILWESSPGRLQALWFLDSTLKPERAESLNKALTYYNGADNSGWDLTQVLRVPGTRNLKYDRAPKVRVIDQNLELSYNHRRVAKRIGFDAKAQPKEKGSDSFSKLSFDQIMSKYRRKIPAKVKMLLMQKHVPQGKRSDMLWFIENKLNEAGLRVPEILTLVRESNWNKFKGRRDEEHRLKTELEKIIENNISVPDADEMEEEAEEQLSAGLTMESYGDVMSSRDSNPGWLVEGFWMKESHGAIAGEPKSFKSTLAMDLGMAVASGKPFLNQFKVVTPGPVIYVQNENARWIMKDRMAKIATHKGLIGKVEKKGATTFDIRWAPEIPLYTVNQQSFLLTDPIHQKQLIELIERVKPVLVIFDPLYLMFDGDINSARELSPVLTWLLELRVEYKCGVVLIHHWRKSNGENGHSRGGQRMLGSTTIHGWIESAWYVSVDADVEDPDDYDSGDLHQESVNKASAKAMVTIDREFRGAGLHPRIDIGLTMGEMGKFEYGVEVSRHRAKAKRKKGVSAEERDELILEMLSKKPKKETHIVRDSGFTKEEVKQSIDRLTGNGNAKRSKEGVSRTSKV